MIDHLMAELYRMRKERDELREEIEEYSETLDKMILGFVVQVAIIIALILLR